MDREYLELELAEEQRHMREHRPLEEPGAVEEYESWSALAKMHMGELAVLNAEQETT